MGKPKKYLIKTINFGEVGNPSRILIENYEKEYKGNVSQLIRRLVFVYLSDQKEFNKWKVQSMIHERKELGKYIAKKIKRRSDIDQKLMEEGIDPNTL